jgi:leucyl aminopeptidase (aminopeptidase T)
MPGEEQLMRDSTARVAAHAAVLVDYSVAVQPGETVALDAPTLATPLVEALFTRVLERAPRCGESRN